MKQKNLLKHKILNDYIGGANIAPLLFWEDKMEVLLGCEPQEVFSYFEKLCEIPHGSGNTKAISDYCVEFAQDRGLTVIQDPINNIIIIKEATLGYEKEETIILQGHLDMVCEKREDSTFDLKKDGLVLETDNQWIWAKDTTLGGDDGIAIAMILAILDSQIIPHPRLEVIFTVDEEIGLIGATEIDLSMLRGKKLINIDGEDDNQIITSCAGGVLLEGRIPLNVQENQGMEYTIELKGLLGGHSGVDIHKERGNSNLLMGRILYALKDMIYIVDVDGGHAHNVIPNYTKANILLSSNNEEVFESAIQRIELELRTEYQLSEGGLCISAKKGKKIVSQTITEESKILLLNALMNLPNGIQTMSAAIPGLVETSLNLGVCKIENNHLYLTYNIRSSKESAKGYLVKRASYMIQLLGGTCQENGVYPGWEYKKDSELRDTMVDVYQKLFGEAPRIEAIHAGLECGIIGSKIKDLDGVSIGPNLENVHSVYERLEIKSVEKIWKLLKAILALK